MRSPAYLLVAAVSYPIVRLLFRTRWRGTENVPRHGGAVVASNHLSNFDPWPLALGVFPTQFRFMAKAELFDTPLRGILRALGGFPVDRAKPDRSSLTTAVEVLRSGYLLLMVPEGTRRSKGLRKQLEPMPHAGAARIALRAKVPLIPAAVGGTDRLSRLAPLRVVYGPPIPLDDLASLDRKSAAAQATSRLVEAIDRLEQSL